MRLSKNNKGLALVAVLWLVLILIAIVTTASRSSRLDTKVQLSHVDEMRCRWAGRAGVEKAAALLYEDERETDALTDLWSDNAADLNDIAMEGCVLNIKVVDETSKLNINTVTAEQLLVLPEMTQEIADAIVDWRDSDDQVQPSGAEAGYYENIDYPYYIRNDAFRTIRELLMVRGVTKELLYGEDWNLNGQLDYNENDGDQSLPYDDADDILDEGWISYLTCYPRAESQDSPAGPGGTQQQTSGQQGGNQQSSNQSQSNNQQSGSQQGDDRDSGNQQGNQQTSNQQSGNQQSSNQGNSNNQSGNSQNNSEQDGGSDTQINVNTASVYVLAALLGGDDTAWQTAENIIAYRESMPYGIEDPQELEQVQGMNSGLFQDFSESITVVSDVFMIRCWATANRGAGNGITVITEAVVDRRESPYELLYWYQGAGN